MRIKFRIFSDEKIVRTVQIFSEIFVFYHYTGISKLDGIKINPLGANHTKWSNKFVGFWRLIVLVFGDFVGLALKGFRTEDVIL